MSEESEISKNDELGVKEGLGEKERVGIDGDAITGKSPSEHILIVTLYKDLPFTLLSIDQIFVHDSSEYKLVICSDKSKKFVIIFIISIIYRNFLSAYRFTIF